MRANAVRILKGDNYQLAFNAGRTGFGDDTKFTFDGAQFTSSELAETFGRERAVRWAEVHKPGDGENLVVVYLHGGSTFAEMAAVKRLPWFRRAIQEQDEHIGCIEWDAFVTIQKRKKQRSRRRR